MRIDSTEDIGNRNGFRFALDEDSRDNHLAHSESDADFAGLSFLKRETDLTREQIETVVDKVSACRHPANTNPIQTPAELASLFRSMVSGYDNSEPVLVVGDKIVDGVNREIVAELIRVARQPDFECSIREIAEGDATKTVKGKNARRNLREVSKAFQAAHMLRNGGEHGAQVELSLDMGVSTRSIRAASEVLKKIPELEGHILAGCLALMAGDKIARSNRHITEARDYLSKHSGYKSSDVKRKLADIGNRAQEALADRNRISTLLEKVEKVSSEFHRHFKKRIERETERETAEAIRGILNSPEVMEAMIAVSKDPEHEDQTLAQLVALVKPEPRKSEAAAASAEGSSTARRIPGPEPKPESKDATYAAFARIFKELEDLTEELLREYSLPAKMRDNLVKLLRDKADLVEKTARLEEAA
jgi:hypothetical protein